MNLNGTKALIFTVLLAGGLRIITHGQTPSVPGNFTASSDRTDAVNLLWNSAAYATGYEVWRSPDGVFTNASLRSVITGSRSYADTAWPPGTPYNYWLRSKNSEGFSVFAGPIQGLRKKSPPGTILWNLSSEPENIGEPIFDFLPLKITRVRGRTVIAPSGSTGIIVPSALEKRAVTDSEGRYYVCESNANEHAVNAYGPDNQLRWSFALAARTDGVPCINREGEILIGDSTKLYCLSDAGTLKWSRDIGVQSAVNHSPILGINSTVFVKAVIDNGFGSKLYCFSRTGEVNWMVDGGVAEYGVVGKDGTFYRPDLLSLTAINTDGTTAWTVEGRIRSGMAIGDDGTIYALSDAFDLTDSTPLQVLAISPSGQLKWSAPISGQKAAGSGIMLHESIIYFGTVSDYSPTRGFTTKASYAVQVMSGAERSGWPMQHYDTLHSRRVTPAPELEMAGTKLIMRTEPFRFYSVEESSDLLQWKQVTNLQATGASTTISTPASMNGRSFFRGRTP